MTVANERVIGLCAESPAAAGVLFTGRASQLTALAVVQRVTVAAHPDRAGLTGAKQARRELTGRDVTEQA